MKKIKLKIQWPWAGTEDTTEIVEMEGDPTEKEIDEFAYECLVDMIFNSVYTDYEILDDDEDEEEW